MWSLVLCGVDSFNALLVCCCLFTGGGAFTNPLAAFGPSYLLANCPYEKSAKNASLYAHFGEAFSADCCFIALGPLGVEPKFAVFGDQCQSSRLTQKTWPATAAVA